MITTKHEHFEYLEIEHDFRTYYANGYVTFRNKECIGTDYEGYIFEMLYSREIYDLIINKLWYNKEGEIVDVLGKQNYKNIEEIAKEVIRYEFE